MTITTSIRRVILFGCLMILAGCASVDTTKTSPEKTAPKTPSEKSPAKPSSSGVTAQREERRKMVVAEFDLQRDRAQYQAALSRWQQGDAAGARVTLAPLLARNPDHRETQLLAAQLDVFDDKPKAALERARHILVAQGDDPQAHYLAALALDAMGATADALPHYEKAAQLVPKEEIYQASYQAALTATMPSPNGSAALNDVASGVGGVELADTSASAGKDGQVINSDIAVDGRLAELRQALSQRPDDPQIAVDAAVYALRQNRPSAAIEIATTALKRTPDSAPLYRILGMAQYRDGDFAAAQLSLGRAISLDKSNALAYFLLGSALSRMGESEAARQHFDEAARLDPRFNDRPN